MANRGICGSLSSIPVEMGDCGAAYVDISPVTPNLCFQIPLITTGGAKPLSLSLLYNEITAQSSSGGLFPGGPFPGGFRLSLYRLVPTPVVPLAALSTECADGPSRSFAKKADGRFHSPEDPVSLAWASSAPTRYRAYLNETDYLEYEYLNPYPLSCASSTAGTPAFTMSGGVFGPASISLEGGRRVVFSCPSDQDLRCVEVREEKEESGSWRALQTIRLQYDLSGDDPILSRITAFLGSPGQNDLPFRDVSFSKGQDGSRVWRDELRSLEWRFAWDAQDSRVAHFLRKGPGFNDGQTPDKTQISYSAYSSTVTGPSGLSKTVYFKGDLPYLSCDGRGVAEAFRYDGAKRRLLFRSGPVCLNPESALNAGQPLARPFFGPGAASAWSLPAGYAETDPVGIGPAPYPDNTGAVSSASLSQTVAKAGLPGDSFTFSALIRGSGSGSGKPSATIRLLKGGVVVASSAKESIFPTSAGRPELLCASVTAPSSFDQISVSLTCDDPFVSEACLLLGRAATLDAYYDALGRLVEANPSSPDSAAAIYLDATHPYLVGGPRSFSRYWEPSRSGDFETQGSLSMWGLRSEEGRDLSSFLPVWSESWVPGAQGSVRELRDYYPDLLLYQETGADGVIRSYEYASGSDLPSGSVAGPDPSDPLLTSELSYSSPAALYDPYAPWAVSSLSHSASDNLSWAFSYSYDSAHLLMSSATEGPSGALPADLMSTSWSYDGLGNPTSVSQSSNAYASMAYSDQHGMRLLSSLSYGTGSFSWSYDELGRPVSVSYAEPNQTPSALGAYSYDEFGRPTQALGESYSWNDDGSLASVQCGSLSISYSRFGAHSSESVSFNNENPTIVSSHGPEACSYGDPGLAKALFQLIPGLLSTVFEGDPLGEPSGTSWQPAPADLEMRHSGGSLAPLTVDPFASLERHGSAACLRQVDGMANAQNLRYAFPSPGPASSAPGMSFGAWLRPDGEWGDGVLLQLSLGCSYSGAGGSGSAGASLVLRLADSGAELVAQSAQGEEVLLPSVPFSIGAWSFVCVGLSFGGQGNALDSVSLRVGSITQYAGPPISLPPMPFPQADATVELSLLGPAIAVPFPPTVAQRPVPGLVYSPFATIGGRALTGDEASFAFRETGRALLGGADPLPSPLAARTFHRPAAPAGIEAIVPLEGGFSPIVGSLRPSRVTAPSGPMARAGDLFRFDPVEHRFRYYSGGEELYWSVPTLGDGLCLAFCVRPSDLGTDAPPAERTLCAVALGAGLCSLVLSGTSLYLRSAEGDSLLGACAPSSSNWVVLAFWQRSVGSGFLPRKESGVTVHFGDGYAFTGKSATLGFAMPAEAKVLFGQPSYAPFGGFVDRLCLWRGAWSFSKMAAVRSFFEGQKASVEEIDPFGQLTSRSTHGPSGLSITTSFAPLVVQEGAESLRRPGLISSEGYSVNGTSVSSLGREHEYDYFGRLTESFAVGADHEGDDPLDSYEYDGLGRLKSWTDANGDKTQYTWSGGHVTKVKKGQLVTAAFSYSGHRLTSAYLASITYRSDAPMLVDRISLNFGLGTHCAVLSYMGRTITGVSVQGNFSMTPCSFSYDARGRRTSKTSNGATHSYFYEGLALIRESITGSPSHDIRFFYHMSGAPAFMTLDGVAYYYVVDAFGSVVGLVDGDGSLVVTYSYDPWGNILSTTDTSGVGLANLNPLRYRSYYYDSETRWYLCGSRYYSPEWMRWVTPDSVDYLDPETPGGLDPYAYCYGDPVMYSDRTGRFPIVALLIATIAGALIATGIEAGKQAYNGGNWNWEFNTWNWWEIGSKALLGAASGFALAVGGAIGAAVYGTVSLTASAGVLWTGIAAVANFSAGAGAYFLHATGQGKDYNVGAATLWGFAQLGRGAISYISGFAFGATGLWKMDAGSYFQNLGPHGRIGAFAKTARDALLCRAPVRFALSYFPDLWFDEWFV